jgi:hypothetical protein
MTVRYVFWHQSTWRLRSPRGLPINIHRPGDSLFVNHPDLEMIAVVLGRCPLWCTNVTVPPGKWS